MSFACFRPYAVLGFYLVFRMGFDFWWRERSQYASYAFEALFVLAAAWIYRTQIRTTTPRLFPALKPLAPHLGIALLAGATIYRGAAFVNVAIPFNLHGAEILFLLLLLGPVLEEAIFRLALWEGVYELSRKPARLTVVTTALLFSASHLQALAYVPDAFRGFIIYQGIYTFFLGLGAGWARVRLGAWSASVWVHMAFNLGFYLASL